MKRTLFFATFSLVLATPGAFAKSELDLLRAKCKEQEAQIRLLEAENMKLGGKRETTPESEVQPKADLAPVVSKTAEPPSTSHANSYTVKAGDSFEKIARKIGTTPEKLAKTNGLKTSAPIQIGQQLKVPDKASTPVTAALTSSKAAGPAAASLAGKTHTVRQGETYSTISRKYKISTDVLIAANPKIKPTAMRPGQVINLGKALPSPSGATATTDHHSSQSQLSAATLASKTTAPKSPAPAQTLPISTSMPKHTPPSIPAKVETVAVTSSAPPAAAAETPATHESSVPSSEKKIQPIIIAGEITYGEFAAKHGTSPERLNALNGLDLTNATVLAKGSELYVPTQP